MPEDELAAHYEANADVYAAANSGLHEALHLSVDLHQVDHDSAMTGLTLGFLLGIRWSCEYQKMALKMRRRLWSNGLIKPDLVDLLAGHMANVLLPVPNQEVWFDAVVKPKADGYRTYQQGHGETGREEEWDWTKPPDLQESS